MNIRTAFFLMLLLFCGCEHDYDIGGDGEFTPEVVVNSMISPDGPIIVELFWSIPAGEVKDSWSEFPYPPVETFSLTLIEDGNVLLDAAGFRGGFADTGIVPVCGRTYAVEIDVPGYGRVTAQTSIPEMSSCRFEFMKRKGDYTHFSVNDIVSVTDCLSYWIFLRSEYQGEAPEGISEIYSINPYVDQINAVFDSWEMDQRESNIGFEEFIRIPRRNLSAAQPLYFSLRLWKNHTPDYNWEDLPEDEWGNKTWPDPVPLRRVILDLVAPSDDFDQYHKTLYKQNAYGGFAPFVFEVLHVYSNIENGIGIFAGYAQNSIYYEVPVD